MTQKSELLFLLRSVDWVRYSFINLARFVSLRNAFLVFYSVQMKRVIMKVFHLWHEYYLFHALVGYHILDLS